MTFVYFVTIIEVVVSLFAAELGDYDPTMHTDGYVSEFRFVPNQVSKTLDLVINQSGI